MNTAVMRDTGKCSACGVTLPENSARLRCDRCLISERLLLSDLDAIFKTEATEAPSASAEAGTDFGDYVLLDEIARGGMGSVHRARQKSLNRIVALKRPLPGIAADEDLVRRFRTEAESVAGLSHPNIIPVFESGEWNGEPFFSMAYVEGEPLNLFLHRKNITPAQAARYVRQIAVAIHHAHQRGVLHRDLKPANILIDSSDEPRVADFGIACLLRGEATGTEDDFVAGTANYMAPEQIQPGNKPLSVATDVYALGGILYHLLTGTPPFDGQSRDRIFWSAYYEDPAPPSKANPQTPRDLEAICLKALEKDPERRYASAQALADDLERFEQGRPVEARPVPPVVQWWMWGRRNPILAGTSVLLFVAVISAITLQWIAFEKVREARAASEGFIGFMNGDLVQDLSDAGRLDLMEKVNAKAEEYYTNYTAFADAGFWERKALFYENAASVEQNLGEPVKSEARALQAEAIHQQQHEREPHEPRWLRNLSRARLLRMENAQLSGQRSVAASHAASAVAFAEDALRLAPDNVTNRACLAAALKNQSQAWIDLKLFEEAETNITRVVGLLRDLTALPSCDPEWYSWIGTCSFQKGLICQARSDFHGALAAFSDYADRAGELARRHPQNTHWQYQVAVANSRIAQELYKQKDYVSARAYLDAWQATSKQLTEIDPRNASWLSMHALSLGWQGSLAKQINRADPAARDYFRMSLAIQSNLVARSPDWNRWLDAAMQTTIDLAHWHRAQGQKPEALAILADWRRQCRERSQSHPENIEHYIRWERAVVEEAEMIGRFDGAERLMEVLRQALSEIPEAPPEHAASLARLRMLTKVAEAYGDTRDFPRAAAQLHDVLKSRLNLFKSFPALTKSHQYIPNDLVWTVEYLVRAGHLPEALDLAWEGMDWAAGNLRPSHDRHHMAKMCWLLARETGNSDAAALERIKRLVRRCFSERLAGPPALAPDEQKYADRLREWLAQHP